MKKAILILFLLLLPFDTSFADDIHDPLESFNRRIFEFNEAIDKAIVEPIAVTYKEKSPSRIYKGIYNFFRHIKYPIYLASDLLQFKFKQAARHTSRFIVNTTIGFGGFIDFAERIGYEHHQEDFGTALAYYGVPTGPYIMLPFIGPSNLRDTLGLCVDVSLHPTSHITSGADGLSSLEKFSISSGITTVDFINQRAQLIDAIRSGREASLDYYQFMKAAYHQHRQNIVYDGNPPNSSEDWDEAEFYEEADFYDEDELSPED